MSKDWVMSSYIFVNFSPVNPMAMAWARRGCIVWSALQYMYAKVKRDIPLSAVDGWGNPGSESPVGSCQWRTAGEQRRNGQQSSEPKTWVKMDYVEIEKDTLFLQSCLNQSPLTFVHQGEHHMLVGQEAME